VALERARYSEKENICPEKEECGPEKIIVCVNLPECIYIFYSNNTDNNR